MQTKDQINRQYILSGRIVHIE